MKKLIKIILCITLLTCLSGCNNSNISNPIKEYKSLEEINKLSGANLIKPDGNVIDIAYKVIESEDIIAEYDFKIENVEYAFRYSKASFDKDISGYYLGSEPAFSGEDYGLAFVNPKSDVRLARWQDELDGQYVLIAEGNLDQNEFFELVYELSEKIGTKKVDKDDIPTSNFSMQVEEDGENIICYTYPIEDAATSPVTKITYVCEGEKIVKVLGDSIYNNEELAKAAYEDMIMIYGENEVELNGNIVSMVLNDWGIEDMTRTELLNSLMSSVTMLEE